MTPVAPSHCGRLRLSALLLLAALFATLPACSAYNLQGKVIDGPASQITIVDAGDPRLDQPGLAGASIETMLDPNSLARKALPAQASGGDGTFAIPVDEIGAGFLEYEAGFIVQRPGYQTAHAVVPVPGADKRVLVILHRGTDRFVRPDDPLGDSQRFLPGK